MMIEILWSLKADLKQGRATVKQYRSEYKLDTTGEDYTHVRTVLARSDDFPLGELVPYMIRHQITEFCHDDDCAWLLHMP